MRRDTTQEAGLLVLFRRDNYGFSVPVVFRNQFFYSSGDYSHVKQGFAAAKHHRDALRISLSMSTNYVAPLARGTARAGLASEASALDLACEAHLAVNLDKQTELAIATSKELGEINYG